ncbi:MAG: Acryloyl-CoA reductase electron transfer subunit beta [Syntrophorhabdaceae bacterium PtaU1.Bin034]|nr:MAG: Acryloyl-CoA reductase electron transfer subunit beta [Syntrophorhabdaceae bacterium PtaU1.Bin034]
MENLLLFIETKDNEPKKACLELLSEAKRLKNEGKFKVHAVVMGKPSEDLKNKVRPYVDILVGISDPVLEQYTPEAFAAALAAYAREITPQLILSSATQVGRDFMPRVAVLFGAGIASDVTAVDWSRDPVKFVRPVYGGKVLSEVSFSSYPGVVTVRPNAFVKEEPGADIGDYAEKVVGVHADQVKTKVLNISEPTKGKMDLIEADIIVAGGRGLKSAENFAMLEELADVIGGAVGAARSVVDAKWRDQEEQVGKSGKTVSPKLYIAAGISGAVHHIMGMDTSKVVVAINTDPNAIIFNYADYGIVGDFAEVVPPMTEEFKKRLGR